MAGASLLFELKRVYDDGRIVEARIWLVPIAVRGSDHQLKYSLSYGSDGDRVVGYDNEAGKGDHRHYNDRQEAYAFTTVEKLVADFLADVSRIRGDAI